MKPSSTVGARNNCQWWRFCCCYRKIYVQLRRHQRQYVLWLPTRFFQIEKFGMSTITMILFTHSHKGLAWGIEQRAIFENGCQLYEFRKPKYPAAKRMPSATNHGNNACNGAGEISKATSSSTQLLKANKKNNIKHTTFWVQCPSIRKVPWRCTSTKLN